MLWSQAVIQCKVTEKATCDSIHSGDPESLIGPLRDCPFRCQNWTLGRNTDCTVDQQPVFGTVQCSACQTEACLEKVPEACLEAGALQAGFAEGTASPTEGTPLSVSASSEEGAPPATPTVAPPLGPPPPTPSSGPPSAALPSQVCALYDRSNASVNSRHSGFWNRVATGAYIYNGE